VRNCSLGENGNTANGKGVGWVEAQDGCSAWRRGGGGGEEWKVGGEKRRFRYARYVPGISRNIRAARILDMPTCV